MKGGVFHNRIASANALVREEKQKGRRRQCGGIQLSRAPELLQVIDGAWKVEVRL